INQYRVNRVVSQRVKSKPGAPGHCFNNQSLKGSLQLIAELRGLVPVKLNRVEAEIVRSAHDRLDWFINEDANYRDRARGTNSVDDFLGRLKFDESGAG